MDRSFRALSASVVSGSRRTVGMALRRRADARLAIFPVLTSVALIAAAPAAAQRVVEAVTLAAIEEEGDWFFFAEVFGAELSDAMLTPPVGAPIELDCVDFGPAETECFFESLGFASLSELLEAFPEGAWQVSIDAGAAVATLPVSFVEPDGTVTVESPADGAVGIASAPTIEYTHDCSNCNALLFELVSLDLIPAIALERVELGEPPFEGLPPTSGALELADFDSFGVDPPPSELPAGTYELVASAVAGSVTTETLSTSEEFQYVNAAFRDRFSIFTVPEPGAATSGGLALVVVLALARRRRGRHALCG